MEIRNSNVCTFEIANNYLKYIIQYLSKNKSEILY